MSVSCTLGKSSPAPRSGSPLHAGQTRWGSPEKQLLLKGHFTLLERK